MLRWPTEVSLGYENEGLGIKLIVGCFLLLMINYGVIEKKFWRKENIIIITLFIATFLYGPFGRYYHFYAHLVLFSNLFVIANRRNSKIT